ncbi:MAG: PKD domain-containing protein, partial [Pseudomonadota bacterium]
MIDFRIRLAAMVLVGLPGGCGGGSGGSSGSSAGTGEASAAGAPLADAGADQRVTSHRTVTLDGSGSSDPDGDIAGYRWAQQAGPAVTLTGANSPTASFTAPAVSEETRLGFRLTVTDAGGASSSDRVAVTVEPGFTVSGTITAARGTVADSDVNDPNAPRRDNSLGDDAQALSNPASAGGYVNSPGAGEPGASQFDGDVRDFYRVSLVDGQRLILQIADPGRGDIDLFLWDGDG